MCTALQAVASPLGHTANQGRVGLRADDGIRTRDPHLGKVMRYQLRYIRMSHPVALPCHPATRENISRQSERVTNRLVSRGKYESRVCNSPFAPTSPPPHLPFDNPPPSLPIRTPALRSENPQVDPRFGVTRVVRVNVSSRSERAPQPAPDSHARSHSSAGERSPHTREVAGSKPAGTTRSGWSVRFSAMTGRFCALYVQYRYWRTCQRLT